MVNAVPPVGSLRTPEEVRRAILAVAANSGGGGGGQGGPQGPQGPQGKPGEEGPPGADGEDGADGADGLPGADGSDGVDGKDGVDGIEEAPVDGLQYARQDEGWVEVEGSGFDGEHVLTGDPVNPPEGWVAGQLLYDGWEDTGDGSEPHDHDYLPLAGGTLTGDLTVDGTLTAETKVWLTGGTTGEIIQSKTSGRSILVVRPDATGNGPQLQLLGDSDPSNDAMAFKDASGNYLFRQLKSGLFWAYSDLKVDGHITAAGGTVTTDLQVDGELIVPSAKAITTGSPTSIPSNANYGLAVGNASSNKGALAVSADSTATRYPVEFFNPNGVVGRIVTQGTATRYDTSATRTNEATAGATVIPDALGTLEALKFRRFTDDDGVDGAAAHNVYPFAVSAGMDAENPEYGVDYGRFTPLLGAAVLELLAKVKELSAEVEELKGN